MNRLRSRSIIGLMSLLLLLLGLPAGLRAQDSLYTITGRVLDEKSEALLGASVSLLQSDGKLKTGAITAKDGAFHLKGIAAGSYTLRVSYVRVQDPHYPHPSREAVTHPTRYHPPS